LRVHAASWRSSSVAVRPVRVKRTSSGQQGGQDADRGGPANPVGTQHAEYGARLDREADAVERQRGAEALDEALGLDRVVHVSLLV